MNTRKTVRIILILILLVVAWGSLRVHLYFDIEKAVVLSDGLQVTVRLAEVKRIASDTVRVRMDIRCKPGEDQQLVVPDVTVTRPPASRLPFFPEIDSALSKASGQEDSITTGSCGNAMSYEDGFTRVQYTTYFRITEANSTIDIVQPLYSRKPGDTVQVELPLTGTGGRPTVRQTGTARVELLDFGRSERYGHGPWRVLTGGPADGPPPDTFCVRVRQIDPNGPLIHQPVFAPDVSEMKSCTAELVDRRGRVIPMTANYVAKADCEFLRYETDLTPAGARMIGTLAARLSFGRIRIPGERKMTTNLHVPGNGEWLYAFTVKDPSKYTRIRIKYVLPPPPQDRVSVTFKKVPI